MPSSDFLYATCAPGLESLLATELREQGAADVNTAGAGVRFGNSLESAYRACLWSRVANRVLMPVHRGSVASPEDLYARVQEVDWSEHMDVDSTLAVDFYTAHSNLTHSQYGALKVKDAVVDQFRAEHGRRPNVDRESPDLRINVYLYRNQARIALDLSGASLHRRGYRQHGGLAPLKENLAASLLLACDWPAIAARGGSLVDPLCGSGTLLIEAAMIAGHQAPGLQRSYFGFLGWRQHQADLWDALRKDAQASVREVKSTIIGCDGDSHAVSTARQNVQAAGLEATIDIRHQSLDSDTPASNTFGHRQDNAAGLVLSNPPYGERLSGDAAFYTTLGRHLSRCYAGWSCGVFTANQAPLNRARLPLVSSLSARNGGIDCALYIGKIPGKVKRRQAEVAPAADGSTQQSSAVDITPFVNRLRKNQRVLKSWLSRDGITAWRVYDADLPEFAVAIDVYDCSERHLVVQEYQAPITVNSVMAQARMTALVAALPEALATRSECIHVRVRERKSGTSQYEKQAGSGVVDVLHEHGCRYELNFSDYLDTGLFLDHRKVRRYIQEQAQTGAGRFLNLFAYTGGATVAAAVGGAAGSVSVDLSNRYCQWLARNLEHNAISSSDHEIVRSDVVAWLQRQPPESCYDLILLDPPTFSNSTGTDADWNVQRDHVACLKACLALLKPDGLLIFSNNFRRFKLDKESLAKLASTPHIEDRTRWSIDRDFQRNPRIHQCWFIRHQGEVRG